VTSKSIPAHIWLGQLCLEGEEDQGGALLRIEVSLGPESVRELEEQLGKKLTIWRVAHAHGFLATTRGESQVHVLRTIDDRWALCGARPLPGYTWQIWPYDDQGLDEVYAEQDWEEEEDGELICACCQARFEALEQAR
jgi:hypothetical protein